MAQQPVDTDAFVTSKRPDLGDDLKDAVTSKAHELKDAAADKTSEFTHKAAETTPSDVADAATRARAAAQANPLQSAAAGALVAGFALGRLTARRKRS